MTMPFDARLTGGMSIFAAVVETGSFVRAAEALDMSPPGVSRAIARLEERLQVRMFDRTTRSVRLTDAGRRFHERVGPILAAIEAAAGAAVGSAEAVAGKLRVNVDPYFSRLMLAPKLGEFHTRYPGIELDIVSSDALGNLVADGFDLAVRFGFPPRASSVHSKRLLETRVLTVAAPGYFKHHERPRQPQALARGGHTFIHFRDSFTGKPFEWEFHRGRRMFKFSPPGNLVLNDAGTLLELCRSGYGIAQVFELGMQPSLVKGRLEVLFPAWCDERYPLYAFTPHRQLRPARAATFLEFVTRLTRAK